MALPTRHDTGPVDDDCVGADTRLRGYGLEAGYVNGSPLHLTLMTTCNMIHDEHPVVS